jgi:hypothetical protein
MKDWTIWKYQIDVDDTVTIDMPQGATVLHIAPSSATGLLLWATVNPDAPTETRTFHVRGTGHPLGNVGSHLGTVQAGPFVWHVFEGGVITPTALADELTREEV